MIKFGTSGFRGVLGDNYTKESVQRIAYALCEIVKEDKVKKPEVVVGYDNRFMSTDFAKWASEVLATAMKVVFYEIPAPTPLVSYEAKKRTFGFMLTASHNPYCYNGVKVQINGGRDCDDVYAKRIEKFANEVKYETIKSIPFAEGVKSKKIVLANDVKNYCDGILNCVDKKQIQKSKLKVLVNAMHGNSVTSINYLFKKLKLNYEIMKPNIDPYFEGGLPAPYIQNIQDQAKRVVKEKFDIGVAFDGDSDRFAMISSSGKYYDCNFAGAVIYYYLVKYKNQKVGIAKNYANTSLVRKLAEKFGTNCYDTVVGFKNVALCLLDTDAIMGIESNGVAYKPHSLIKDGPLTATLIIDALCTIGKSFDDILKEMQDLVNFKSEIVEYNYILTDEQRAKLYEKIFVQKETPDVKGRTIADVNYDDGCKVIYDDGYWGMFRFSGTEKIIRVYAEMKNKKECDKLVEAYEKFLGVKERQ